LRAIFQIYNKNGELGFQGFHFAKDTKLEFYNKNQILRFWTIKIQNGNLIIKIEKAGNFQFNNKNQVLCFVNLKTAILKTIIKSASFKKDVLYARLWGLSKLLLIREKVKSHCCFSNFAFYY
jgi:hypothetical protein